MAPSTAPRAFAAALLVAGSARALGTCAAGPTCTYAFSSPALPGGSFTLNLRPLCNAEADYALKDNVGHMYYAQICGTASTMCAP